MTLKESQFKEWKSLKDMIFSKVKCKILWVPYLGTMVPYRTIFLAQINTTLETINNHILDVLFQAPTSLMIVANGLRWLMSVYRNISHYNGEQVCNIVCCLYYSFLPNFYLSTCHRETTCNMISTVHGYYLDIIAQNFRYSIFLNIQALKHDNTLHGYHFYQIVYKANFFYFRCKERLVVNGVTGKVLY